MSQTYAQPQAKAQESKKNEKKAPEFKMLEESSGAAYTPPPPPPPSMPNGMGHGRSLSDSIRSRFENAFGADLSAVRLYEHQSVADSESDAIASGNRIVFAPGMMNLSSRAGQRLLGHELSHVVSQARGEVSGRGLIDSPALEARADREGDMAAAGQQIYAPSVSGPLSIASADSASGPIQAKSGKRRRKNKQKAKSTPVEEQAQEQTQEDKKDEKILEDAALVSQKDTGNEDNPSQQNTAPQESAQVQEEAQVQDPLQEQPQEQPQEQAQPAEQTQNQAQDQAAQGQQQSQDSETEEVEEDFYDGIEETSEEKAQRLALKQKRESEKAEATPGWATRLGSAWKTVNSTAYSSVSSVWSKLGSAFSAIAGPLKKAAGKAGKALSPVTGAIGKAAKQAGGWVMDKSKKAGSALWELAKTGAGKAADAVRKNKTVQFLWGKLKSAGKKVAGAVMRTPLGNLIRKNQQAVDKFNNFQEDYKKMSFKERAMWSLKNPIARLTAGFRKSGTEERNLNEAKLNSLADKYAPKFKKAFQDSDAAADPYQLREAGGGSKEHHFDSKKGNLMSVLGDIKSVSSTIGDLVPGADKLSTKVNNKLADVSKYALTADKLLGISKEGDKEFEKVKEKEDTDGSTAEKSDEEKAKEKEESQKELLDIATDTTMDVISFIDTRGKLKGQMNNLGDKKKLSRGAKTRYRTLKQAGSMNKIGMAEKVFTALGRLSTWGSKQVDTKIVKKPLEWLGKGLTKAGKLVTVGAKAHNRKNVVYEELNMEPKIKFVMDHEEGLDYNDAKKVVLRAMGFSSGRVKEAYQTITMNRAAKLQEAASSKNKKVSVPARKALEAMGVAADADEFDIAKAMGMTGVEGKDKDEKKKKMMAKMQKTAFGGRSNDFHREKDPDDEFATYNEEAENEVETEDSNATKANTPTEAADPAQAPPAETTTETSEEPAPESTAESTAESAPTKSKSRKKRRRRR